ncbi:MAG: tetratricopeptide repeat protein [Acidobacteriota bacterium]|nr:MAG: tetratricopeptide repeat protein [Acidobacteriota bacterium]
MLRVKCFIAVLGAALLLAAALWAQECKEDYGATQMNYAAAVRLMSAGKFKEAIPHWKCCLDYNQRWGEGWSALGDCYLKLKSPENALKCYSNARKSGHESLSMLTNLIGIYHQKGEGAKAKELLEKVDPANFPVEERVGFYALRGKLHFDNKRYGAAAESYKQACRLEKTAKNSYMAGLSLSLDNDPDAAFPFLKDAVSLDSKNHDAKYRLADIYVDKARREKNSSHYAEAAKLASTLTKIKPDEAKYFRLLGEAQIGSKQFDSAIASLKKAASLDPDHCLAKHNLGRAYNFKKDWNSAVRTLTSASKCDPNDHRILRDLGWAYENKFKKEEDADALAQATIAYKRVNQIRPGVAAADMARVEALGVNLEADLADQAAADRERRYEAERKRLLKLIKVTEPRRTTSKVGGATLTYIFATVNNESDTLLNAFIDVRFLNASGAEMQRVRKEIKGLQPKSSRPLNVEVDGVEDAADYQVIVANVQFEFSG